MKPPRRVAAVRDWLADNLPQSPAATIVHGDYRLGNTMVADDAPARLIAKQQLHRVRLQPLGHAEVAERVEDVGGEYAPEVEQEPLHRASATSRAFSASAGTPSSKAARYSSSELPIVKRL